MLSSGCGDDSSADYTIIPGPLSVKDIKLVDLWNTTIETDDIRVSSSSSVSFMNGIITELIITVRDKLYIENLFFSGA